jgi:hypothetical protein
LRITRAEDLDRYDSLYVAPDTTSALLSCSARIAAETGKGMRVLVASLFGSRVDEGVRPSAASLGRIGVDAFEAALPAAAERSASHASCVSRVFGRSAEDDACLERAARILDDVGRKTRARHVCVPLGVGGHIDHRLAHEAGVRVFEPQAERDVLLYEERPAAFVPGAVRIRLAQLGARLPPAAHVAAPSGLLRFLFRMHTAPDLGRALHGVSERFRFTSLALAEWRAARGWDPRRSLGLRVQPIVLDEEAGGAVSELLREDRRFDGYDRRAALYGKALRARASAERYWLLLPSLDVGGLARLPSSA